ncbi:hypothetical protein JTB14_030460 [Gonioctena quinquepunctata]|nr:hypothetical protein JTB14_030460 [Gonioctena quinquepunctata]
MPRNIPPNYDERSKTVPQIPPDFTGLTETIDKEQVTPEKQSMRETQRNKNLQIITDLTNIPSTSFTPTELMRSFSEAGLREKPDETT